jgi:cytochrome c5
MASVGCGNVGVEALDLADNPAIGPSGLAAVAALLAPATLVAEHERRERAAADAAAAAGEAKDAKEADEDAPTAPAGLRVLVAYFAACNGDRKFLAPEKRDEIEAAVERCAKVGLMLLI